MRPMIHHTRSIRGPFADRIYPEFPFTDPSWIAVAFDRDNHDCCRMPKGFFDLVQEAFQHERSSILVDLSDLKRLVEIPFDWTQFKATMCTPENFSVECQLTDPAGRFACWMDAEMTVWGGDPAFMQRILERLGGAEATLANMQTEFGTPDAIAYPELAAYLRKLIGFERA